MHSYSSIVGVSSVGHRYIEVIEEKFHDLIKMLLEDVRVDEAWYRKTYDDVEEAIRSGTFASARDHYIESGYFEDRFPHQIVVDTAWYLENNPDVVEGIRLGRVKSAYEHFLGAGFKEGRLPFSGWSLLDRRSVPRNIPGNIPGTRPRNIDE